MKRALLGSIVALAMLGTVLATAATPAGAGQAKRILIYGPMFDPLPGRVTEATLAKNLGYRITIADAGRWATLTTVDFQAFDAIVFPDPECDFAYPALWDPAVANEATWTAAVNGPVIVATSDPTFHANYGNNKAGAKKFARHAIIYAASGPGTGMYFSTSCAYVGAGPGTPVDALAGFGTFTVQGAGNSNITIVAPDHPAMVGLTSADLSKWYSSVHAKLDGFPAEFEVLAVITKPGTPVVVARGAVASVTVAPLPTPSGSSARLGPAGNVNRTRAA